MTDTVTRAEFELLVELNRHNAARLAFLEQVLAAFCLGAELPDGVRQTLLATLADPVTPVPVFDQTRRSLRELLKGSSALGVVENG